MLNREEYLSRDAVGLAELVASGSISALELLDVAIAAVDEMNPVVNAVVRRFDDLARSQIDEGLPDGPLSGVPYLLKDLTAMYRGVPTSSGSRFFADYVPDYDTTTVARLRDAGVVMFGKTNCPELGGNTSTEPQQWGATKNPWDLGRSAGGSSGGAAAAVASGMVPAAHATDGGGSIRIPAACCGLFGFKPSRGRMSAGPILGEGWSGMSAEHTVTRTIRDSAALLDAVSGSAPGDPYSCEALERSFLEESQRDPAPLKVAMTTVAPSGAEVHPDVIREVERTAALLESLGHQVDEAVPEYDNAALSRAALTIMAVNYQLSIQRRSEQLGREPEQHELERVMWYRLEIAREVTGLDYAAAVQTLHLAGHRVGAFMEEYDVILRPTVAHVPLPLGRLDMSTDDIESFLAAVWGFAPFTLVFNATGQPAMSVPLGTSSDGLPIGVQFGGRRGDDGLLYSLAGQLERADPWIDRIPDVHLSTHASTGAGTAT